MSSESWKSFSKIKRTIFTVLNKEIGKQFTRLPKSLWGKTQAERKLVSLHSYLLLYQHLKDLRHFHSFWGKNCNGREVSKFRIRQWMQTSSCLISRILNTTMFESWEIIGPYPSWWLFNGLLLIIQVLHIIWSYFIIRIAYKAVARGKVCMTNFITRKMSVAFIFFTMLKESVTLEKRELPPYWRFPA